MIRFKYAALLTNVTDYGHKDRRFKMQTYLRSDRINIGYSSPTQMPFFQIELFQKNISSKCFRNILTNSIDMKSRLKLVELIKIRTS